MVKRLIEFLSEFLRINAIRRMVAMVDVKKKEVFGLILFAIAFAFFEGVGLSLLLPILQVAQSGEESLRTSSGTIWSILSKFMDAFHLPYTLPVLLVLAFIPILLRQAVFYLNTWYSAVVSGRIGLRMRMQTLKTLFEADPEFFTRNSVGHLMGIVLSQTGSAGAAILAVFRQFSVVLLILLYTALLFAISVPLTFIAVASAGLVSFAVKANFGHIRDFGIEAARINQEMMSKIVERLSLVRLIKMRDQKRQESDRVESFSEAMLTISIKQARIGATVEVTSDPLLMLSVFVTLYIGVSVLHLTLAQLGLLLFLLNRLNAKVKEFNAGRQAISSNISGLLLVEETTRDAVASNRILSGDRCFTGLKDKIELSNVRFVYPDVINLDGTMHSSGKTVLQDISITIPAGSLTAIVGRSGAGKSTLVELLPRLREATSGLITYDGIDIRELQLGSLRKGIGYLTQSAMLFNDTVRANLVYGLDYAPTDDQIRDALERAYATFVYDLPMGLETGLGDRGVRFSGGECQRIGLARVLLEDNSVLILDEPTSSLDSESESYIQQALRRLHGSKTIIIIAHRLATVIEADQVLVIEDGHIVEHGTHTELVSNEGSYRRLFETQLLS